MRFKKVSYMPHSLNMHAQLIIQYVILEKKHFSWIFTFWKQVNLQILVFKLYNCQGNTEVQVKYMFTNIW